MSMICSQCGGQVVWRGPLHALTHTECTKCGAINAQLPDETQDDSDADQLRDLVAGNADAFLQRTQAAIAGVLKQHTDTVAEFAVHMHNRVRRAEAVADALTAATCTFDGDNDRLTVHGASRLLAALDVYRFNRRI